MNTIHRTLMMKLSELDEMEVNKGQIIEYNQQKLEVVEVSYVRYIKNDYLQINVVLKPLDGEYAPSAFEQHLINVIKDKVDFRDFIDE